MLPPVAAVSSINSTSPPREVAVVSELLSGLSPQPDSSVAQSLAVSAGVEGKLNILLLNARARMLDSLFAVIDAVSHSLALPQAADESKAAYALRLADTMTQLPPKQMAALQQQLSAQGQTAPLSLVAAALHNPAGAEATQLIAYLEVVRYKEKDLATKSVVASYGQNNSQAEPGSTRSPAPVRSAAAQQAAGQASIVPQRAQPAVPTSAPVAVAEPKVLTQPPESVAKPTPAAETPAPPQKPAEPQRVSPSAADATGQHPAAPAAAAADRPLQAAATAPASAPASASASEATIPRANQQIASDIKEGLKAVFDRLVQATGTDLLQTLAEAGPLADKAIAQALIADMIDGTELNGLPLPVPAPAAERSSVLAPTVPVAVTPAALPELATAVATVGALQENPEPLPAAPQAAPAVPAGQAFGFVTTPYAPAAEPVKSKEATRIDRVDAVDDDEHEGPGNQQQQDAEPEDEPETPAEEALEMLETVPVTTAPASAPSVRRSDLAALPRLPEPVPVGGYNLYQSMGA